MNELDLSLGDLKLNIRSIERFVEEAGMPYRDWLKCDVRVSVPSFSGSVEWDVMPGELRTLADQLQRLYDAFPTRGSVAFQPTEPKVTLSFEITRTGAVAGRYEIRNEFVAGDVLAGAFQIEQSVLPRLVNDIRAFVDAAVSAA